jgi:hypothetical protein
LQDQLPGVKLGSSPAVLISHANQDDGQGIINTLVTRFPISTPRKPSGPISTASTGAPKVGHIGEGAHQGLNRAGFNIMTKNIA